MSSLAPPAVPSAAHLVARADEFAAVVHDAHALYRRGALSLDQRNRIALYMMRVSVGLWVLAQDAVERERHEDEVRLPDYKARQLPAGDR